MNAAGRAAGPQPLWAIVPPAARARYLRRLAQALLDELDSLSALLADAAGVPVTEALLAELLPTVAGLNELAEDGPDALADRRLGRPPRRRALLSQAPVGVVGVRGGEGSPWAEPVLEAAAALLAGNGVVFSPAVEALGARLASALGRAGLPDGLLQVSADFDGCDSVVATGLVGPKGAMLVLGGAPEDRAVSAALWGAFARSGRGTASVGRIVTVPQIAATLVGKLEAGTRKLKVGDPHDAETEVGPLPSPVAVAEIEALVAEAEAAGAVRLCGGPLEGSLFAPVVLRGVTRDARLLREPVPGPVIAIVEAEDEPEAIALARPRPRAGSGGMWQGESAPAVSVWTGNRTFGERVARSLDAELTWVNEHGVAAPAAPVRLARHTAARQLATQRTRLRSARWLPYDPALVRASTTAAKFMYGRESERVETARQGGPAFVRTALRLAREAAGR